MWVVGEVHDGMGAWHGAREVNGLNCGILITMLCWFCGMIIFENSADVSLGGIFYCLVNEVKSFGLNGPD